MDMCYEGTLVMPSNCVVMDEEEMTYVEGGGVNTYTGTAKNASIFCQSQMAAWWLLAAGWGGKTALLAIASAGLLAPAGAAGTAYCSYVATQYTAAYNKCQLKTVGGKNPRTSVHTITTLFGTIITGVSVA